MLKASKNIVPANRVSEIKEYYFSRKLKEVAELNRQGLDIISLGIGGPDRPPHASVIKTLCDEAAVANNHGYQPYVGLPELRGAYASWYKKYFNVEFNPATEVLPLIGSKEGILHISMAFLNPGDGVLVPNPGYPTYSSVSKIAGARIFYYDLTEENDWLPDFDALEQLPLKEIKIMWVNYPHMPTGRKADYPTFEKLIRFAQKHGILIVNDNPYSFILNDKQMSIFNVPGAKDVAIEMNSLSKSHNMPGWRMGMVAAKPEFITWITKIKSNIDSGQFKPMMLAAARALECDSDWYAEINKTYSARRKVAEEIMTALGCTFDPSQQGLFLWGKIPASYETSERLADDVLNLARVFLTPGFIFGSNGDKYIRISLCAPIERMNEALNRIKQNIII